MDSVDVLVEVVGNLWNIGSRCDADIRNGERKLTMQKKVFNSMQQVLDKYADEMDQEGGKQRRISREWQDYAYRLALELNDTAHTSLYMRLVKNTPRYLVEDAKNFVKDANDVKSKGKLFMWRLKQLKEEKKKKA